MTKKAKDIAEKNRLEDANKQKIERRKKIIKIFLAPAVIAIFVGIMFISDQVTGWTQPVGGALIGLGVLWLVVVCPIVVSKTKTGAMRKIKELGKRIDSYCSNCGDAFMSLVGKEVVGRGVIRTKSTAEYNQYANSGFGGWRGESTSKELTDQYSIYKCPNCGYETAGQSVGDMYDTWSRNR